MMESEGTGRLRNRSTSRVRKPSGDSDELDWGRRRLDARRETYEGEDTSSTTPRELWGWYCYGLAAEIFAVCGVGSFLPVTLEQLARGRGVLYSDRSVPCISHDATTPKPASRSQRVFRRADANPGNDDQCIISLFGNEITTASFVMYTLSLAVLVQCIVLISLGSFADYGRYRKRLLLALGFTGATASMLFMFVVPSIYVLASVLVIVGVSCLGSSFAILNSFLPLLVQNHSTVRGRKASPREGGMGLERTAIAGSEDILGNGLSHYENDNEHPLSDKRYDSTEGDVTRSSTLSTTISSRGVALGYIAAVSVQILSILLLLILTKVLKLNLSPTLPLRLILFLVGLCWGLFTIPSALWLRPRPGPPFPQQLAKSSAILRFLGRLTLAWRSLYSTLRLALALTQTRLFLLSWFLLSDAIATVSGTALLFARTTLHLSTLGVAALSITATTSGILGAWAWPHIQRHFDLSSKQCILAMIALMELIPLYSLLPYILPFLRTWGWGGLQAWWEIYPLAVLHGFVMGGLSSYCRGLFAADLVPPGKEAVFFALYAVTDKGSSAIGPAIVGRIVDKTGEIRLAFVFLAVLVVAPAGVLWWVDVGKGRDEVRGLGARERAGDVVAEGEGGMEMEEGWEWEDGEANARGEEGVGLLEGKSRKEGRSQ